MTFELVTHTDLGTLSELFADGADANDIKVFLEHIIELWENCSNKSDDLNALIDVLDKLRIDYLK